MADAQHLHSSLLQEKVGKGSETKGGKGHKRQRSSVGGDVNPAKVIKTKPKASAAAEARTKKMKEKPGGAERRESASTISERDE